LQFAPPLGGTPTDESLPDIFTAVQQLGLKLEPIEAASRTSGALEPLRR
jgi:hypothetical protein